MQSRNLRKWTTRSLIGVAAVLVLAPLSAVTASAASNSAHSTAKKLAYPDVSIYFAANDDSDLGYIAQQRGFFTKQGLNVTWIDAVGPSSAAKIAAFEGGAYSFINIGTPTAVLAAQAGGAMKAIFATDIGQPINLTITSAFASAHNIPQTPATTQAQTLAQFLALRGTHLQVSVSGVTSGTYLDLISTCKVEHMTCAVNSPSSDINVVIAGSSANQTAGVAAGTFPALVGLAPVGSDMAGTMVINLGGLKPQSLAPGDEVVTSPSMIAEHPATVQAVVNALVEAWAYAKAHPKSAAVYQAQLERVAGVTSPSEAQELYTDFAATWLTPLLTAQAFDNTKFVLALTGTPVSLTYAEWADPKFVDKAVSDMHIKGLKVPAAATK